jgi:hypothetical protein
VIEVKVVVLTRAPEEFDAYDDDVKREAALVLAVIQMFPGSGNRLLYSKYREAGGRVSWKMFRPALALARGGAEAEAIHTRRAAAEAEATKRQAAVTARAEARRERERQGENMATIRREDLRAGQKVWVKVQIGNQLKLRPARLEEVMRAAVSVTIEGDKQPRMMRFNEIELTDGSEKVTPEAHSTLTAVPSAFAALERAVVVEQRRPLPPQVQQPIVPAPTVENALDKVNSWIEQGSSMRDGLARQREVLQNALDDLAAEALRIEEAAVAKRAELSRLESLLAALDQMRAVVAA